MQDFINHASSGRLLGDMLAGPRSRYYLMALLAFALAATCGVALAAIWLGLALFASEMVTLLGVRAGALPPPSQRIATAALQMALSACLTTAPALVWYARVELAAALAIATLCGVVAHAALNRTDFEHIGWRLAPPSALAAVFSIETALQGNWAGVVLCALAAGYLAASVVYAAQSVENARRQDAEWVRQLNMMFGTASNAAWEIDYQRRELVGADRLSRLLGRAVTYDDLVTRACFAVPRDRDLVGTAFSPPAGSMRHMAIEHEVVREDGSTFVVRHQGFLRTNPDGAPARLTCISEPSSGDAAAGDASLHDALAQTQRILQEQERSLLVLSNELGATEKPCLAPALTGASADIATRLRRQIAAIEDRRARIADAIDDLVREHHDAHEANLAKSQFLASMSHELRTPLNAIIGYAEMLQEDASDNGDENAIQDLTRILTAARHLLSLLNEILDLSKIEAGRIDVTPAPFKLTDVLADLIETVRPLAEQGSNTLAISIGGGDLDANTDATKLRQCVLNLLSNACKFTHHGCIEVGAELRERHGVSQIFITVADTGIGISQEQMSRLFQPFVQADASITRQYGGTGLGLTITRRLAQLLGGDVEVRSTLGKGATFTLHIPADFSDAATALGAAAEVDAVQGAEDAPLVVVIEDEPDAREWAARALTRAGFSVQGVGGGEAGLTLARVKAPALILLDIFLPDRSGWRVLQSLKHDPKTSDIPVIVLSVNEDRAHALALGAAEHIIKPADRDMLAAAVMRLARNRPQLASHATKVQRQAG